LILIHQNRWILCVGHLAGAARKTRCATSVLPQERFRDGATGHEKLAQARRGLTGGPAAAAIRLPMACGGSRGERTGQVRSKCSTGTPKAAAIFCKVA
jgi:hypothetical protein